MADDFKWPRLPEIEDREIPRKHLRSRITDKYGLHELRAGSTDSRLFVGVDEVDQANIDKRLRAAAVARGMRITTRREGDFGIRVWRIK